MLVRVREKGEPAYFHARAVQWPWWVTMGVGVFREKETPSFSFFFFSLKHRLRTGEERAEHALLVSVTEFCSRIKFALS